VRVFLNSKLQIHHRWPGCSQASRTAVRCVLWKVEFHLDQLAIQPYLSWWCAQFSSVAATTHRWPGWNPALHRLA